MQPYTLCYYSATAMEMPSLSEGVRQFIDGGGKIHVHARTQTQLFDEKRQQAFVDQAIGPMPSSSACTVASRPSRPSTV